MRFKTNHAGAAVPGCPAGQSPALRRSASAVEVFATLALLFCTPVFASDCLTIGEARQHIGENKCIVGKVTRVKAGTKVHFVDFCEERAACPFSVVVFNSDLKDVGDVRRLQGRVIEIHGPVKLYEGRAEIILSRISQISGGSALIPAMPRKYDVEKEGHYSAGRIRPSKKPAKTKTTPSASATYGNEADVEEPTQ